MAELTAQQVIASPWTPELRRRGVRLLWLWAGLLAAVGLLCCGGLVARGRGGDPVLMCLLVVGPLAMAGAAMCCVAIIRHHRVVARILLKMGLPIFVGAVAGAVVLVWACSLLLDFVENMVAGQDSAATALRTAYGGELTVAQIQSYLLSDQQRAAGVAGAGGRWATAAYPLWPLQFGLVRDLLLAFGVLAFVAITGAFGIWWERKVAGRIQSRLGPMRVGGWHGWAQGIADGLKLIQKEDVYLAQADRPTYKLAPYLVFVPVLVGFMPLPFGSGWVFRDLDVALIFVLAMVGIDVIGVILGGWASHNKWSLLGAMREACQMVSYEIPMGMSLLVPVMTVGTLKLTEFAAVQSGGFHTWLAFSHPFALVAAVIYFIASLASCKRAPFDLPEAESELVGGFHTEYSGFRWAVFFFGEYAAMFVVSGLAVILFFGAWHSGLPVGWGAGLREGPLWQQALYGLLFSGPLWFIAKAYALLYVQLWLRWTLPRIRIDQVMYACIQVLLPLAMLVLLGSTLWGLLVPPGGWLALAANVLCTVAGATLVIGFIVIAAYGFINRRRLVGTLVVDHLPGS